MEPLQVVLKFIQDYGIGTLISAVFLFAAWQLVNIGIMYLKSRLGVDSYETQKSFSKKTQIDYHIQISIEKTLIETKGNRIFVMEYHDGTENISGIPFYFFSCTYEAYIEDLSPIYSMFQHIRISLHAKFLNAIHKSPYIMLDSENRNANTPKDGFGLLDALEETRALCVPLRFQGDRIGYLSLTKKEEFTESDHARMQELAGSLGTMLGMFKIERGGKNDRLKVIPTSK